MLDLTIQHIAVATLRPYPGNARTHSKKQIKQIARSIERFGFTNPVLISDDDEIIAGHGRVEAAKLLGLVRVPTLDCAGYGRGDCPDGKGRSIADAVARPASASRRRG